MRAGIAMLYLKPLSGYQCEPIVAGDRKSIGEYWCGQVGQGGAARYLHCKSRGVGLVDLARHIVGRIVGNARRLEQGEGGHSTFTLSDRMRVSDPLEWGE